MLVKGSVSGSASARAAEVAGLSYGELALAISCSGMPTVRPRGVKEDPLAYALDGLARVGVDGLRRLDAESSRLVEVKYFGPDKPARRAASMAHSRLWGGVRRFDRAHGLAGRLWHRLADLRAVA